MIKALHVSNKQLSKYQSGFMRGNVIVNLNLWFQQQNIVSNLRMVSQFVINRIMSTSIPCLIR